VIKFVDHCSRMDGRHLEGCVVSGRGSQPSGSRVILPLPYGLSGRKVHMLLIN
jgi:hypothetical protein